MTIEQYGYQLGRAWGIGQKGKNNGALLIVAPDEHKARIEVGYGLEGTLTDAQSKLIIDEFMTARFPARRLRRRRAGDGTAGDPARCWAETKDCNACRNRPNAAERRRRRLWIFIVIILIWIVFGRFLWPLLFLGGGWAGAADLAAGFGGGGFGGGGFSGGGGSFGGGGASGSW
jgi:uncharacterized protein